MTNHRLITLLVGLVVLAVAAGAMPAAADHEESDSLGDVLAPHDDGSLIDTALGAASGAADRAMYTADSWLSDGSDAAQDRDDAIEAFNDHSESFVTYANDRGIADGEVIEIEFEQDGETATGYIVATYDDESGEYTSAEAVTETDRDVDHELRLEGMAADNAAEEIDRFYDEFAADNEDLTTRYLSEMASKYLGLVDEPFTGGGD